MSNIARMMQRATAGAGGAGLDVDEVFSTYLYDGNNTGQSIVNGIDLSGEGGLVWTKARDYTVDHALVDTVRGNTKFVQSNSADDEETTSVGITAFNSTGYTLGADNTWKFNVSNSYVSEYVSWTFRKAPKFFDIVTWTSNGSSTERVNHNLGAVPGHIVMKRTDASGPWLFSPLYSDGDRGYRQSSGTFGFDSTGVIGTKGDLSSGFTATDFRPLFIDGYGTYASINGATYVAYLFAHNNSDGEFGPDGDQDIIKCGSYTGNANNDGPTVNLGFEPQWIMIKSTGSADGWFMFDVMRGITTGGVGATGTSPNDTSLRANSSDAEDFGAANPGNTYNFLGLTPTGFKLEASDASVNGSNTYIYIAIRRGPLAAPEDATKVFAIDTHGDTAPTPPAWNSGFPVDMAIYKNKSGSSDWVNSARLIQGKYLKTNTTAAEASDNSILFDYQNGYYNGSGSLSNFVSWMWKRAPGYFDVCCYTGTGSNRTVSHNLDVEPEIVIVKQRSSGNEFFWYVKSLGNTKKLELPGTAAAADAAVGGNQLWNSTTPTSSVFSVSDNPRVNDSGETYIAYLFATVAGVSKVGSYTGNGSTQNIDCGFSNSARFVLIKETSGTGDWYVLDSERGITTSVAPSLYLNNTNAEDAFNIIDPLSSGFIAKGGLNGSGNSYIFYAIA